MILFDLLIRLPSDKSAEVLQSFLRITESVRVQSGCMGFRIYTDAQADDTICIQQMWETRDALEDHITSEVFRTVLAAMDLGVAAPDVHFYTISKSAGFELIEQVRKPV